MDSHLRTVAEIEYAADEGGDFWQTPEETARRGRGDCEDMALYLHYLLRGDGIESTVVFGVRDARRDRTGHAWVECEMYGQRYVLDPTCRRMAARKLLPPALYYPVIEQPVLAEKLREYLNRTGDRGVNVIFEAPPESPQAP
ncbi:MAG TPA: transglutaminase-like domain-containing protein [Phycisphaerae bacterium]|nr:transglutaminase-like domain-containing protein [Phycisphaerae bacterium]